MNTNDFYKELFEKYAFDEDKIRKKAIKAAKTPAWQRVVGAHWKTAAGAAAAVAVTVGAVVYFVGNGGSGNIDIVPSENLPAAYQRIHDAEQNYYRSSADNEGFTNIYVTFTENLSYNDMSVLLSAISDPGEINVECLYLDDNTVVRGEDAVSVFAGSDGDRRCVAATKLYALGGRYRDVQDLSKVYLAELGSDEINDDTFSPITLTDTDPLSNINEFISTTALPPATTTPFSFESQAESARADNTSPDADTTEPPEDSEEVDPDKIGDINDPDDDDNENDPAGTDATDVPAETDVSETSVPSISDTTSPEITDVSDVTGISDATDTSETEVSPEIGLMTQIYQLNVDNPLETLLVGNNAIVLTRNEVYLFRMVISVGSYDNAKADVIALPNPKIAYSSDKVVILSGCGESGIRNSLLVIDAESGRTFTRDLGESLGSSEIGTVNYSAEGRYFVKAVSEANTYIYELIIDSDYQIQLRPLFEYNGAVAVAGYNYDKLWFTAADENQAHSLFSFDCINGTLKKHISFGSECRIRRSRSFESFIINTVDPESGKPASYVFNTSSGTLISVDIDENAKIASDNGRVFIGTDSGNYSLSSDGTLTEVKIAVNYDGKPKASYQVLESDSEKVVVAEKTGWN